MKPSELIKVLKKLFSGLLSKAGILLVVLIQICAVWVMADTPMKPHDQTNMMDCKLCHTCALPTKKDTCLIYCPRPSGIENKDQVPLEMAPDRVVLDDLAKANKDSSWGSVYFPHQIHAKMCGLKEGCTTCHHNSPTIAFRPCCKDCHDQKPGQDKLEKPGLQGAYHRQCLGCHIDWSKDTDCKTCHRTDIQTSEFASQTKPNPRIKICKEPKKIVFQTNHAESPYVTFFHDDHTETFKLDCKTCHENQPCISCHYQTERPVPIGAISRDMAESKCSFCHNTVMKENCESCHREHPLENRFDHARDTRWALGVYHSEARCEKCHGKNQLKRHTPSSCMACHRDWETETFNHEIAGLILNEDHVDLDCSDCHINKQFEESPNCEGCHEDELSFPSQKPGTASIKGRKMNQQ